MQHQRSWLAWLSLCCWTPWAQRMSACPRWMPVLCTHWLAWASATASRTAGKRDCYCCHALLRLIRSLYEKVGFNVAVQCVDSCHTFWCADWPTCTRFEPSEQGMSASVLILHCGAVFLCESRMMILCLCTSHFMVVLWSGANYFCHNLNSIIQAVPYIAGPWTRKLFLQCCVCDQYKW